MRGDQQRAAGRFIRAARLDSDQTVFDQIDSPDAVRRGNFVQLIEQRDSGPLLSVHRNRRACIESNFDFGRLIRGFFRRNDPLPHRFLGLVRGIFEHAAFVAQVPDVAVARVNVRLGLFDRECCARFAYAMASSRELMVHSRHGAMIFTLGAMAL